LALKASDVQLGAAPPDRIPPFYFLEKYLRDRGHVQYLMPNAVGAPRRLVQQQSQRSVR